MFYDENFIGICLQYNFNVKNTNFTSTFCIRSEYTTSQWNTFVRSI